MPFAFDPRPLAAVLERTLTRRARPLDEGEPMDVCAQWRSKHWAGQGGPRLYMQRGLLHITLCAHDGLRAVILRRMRSAAFSRPASWSEVVQKTLAINGVFISTFKYTRRISIFFFMFCLSIEWVAKVSVEKVDAFEVGREGSRF